MIIDIQTMNEEDFYTALVEKAVAAYYAQYLKLNLHADYYSEKETVTWSVVFAANAQASSHLADYIDAYIYMHQRHPNSPLDQDQAVRQGMNLLKAYSGNAGDKTKFKIYFMQCLLNLKNNPEIYASPTGNLSYHSFEVDEQIMERNTRGQANIKQVTLVQNASDLLPMIDTNNDIPTDDNQDDTYGNFIDLESGIEVDAVIPPVVTEPPPRVSNYISRIQFFLPSKFLANKEAINRSTNSAMKVPTLPP